MAVLDTYINFQGGVNMLKHGPTLCCEIVATCPFSDFRVQDVQDFELLFLSNDGSFQTVFQKERMF